LANLAQSKKRARQNETCRQRNAGQRSMLRTHIKRVKYAISAGEKETATAAYKVAVPVIDRMARKGLIHGNAAARYKSRLNNHIRAM